MQRGAILTFCICLCLPTVAHGATLREARRLLRTGNYAAAEAAFAKLGPREGAAALVGLGRVQLETGRHAEAQKSAERALARAGGGAAAAEALTLKGEVLRARGERPAAEQAFKQALAKHAKAHRARAFLGLVQLERGQAAESRATFDVFYDDFKGERLDQASSEELTYVAMACRYTDNFRDASDTYGDAVKADPENVEAHVQWGEISLEKYEAGHAESHFNAALKTNPRHVGALLGLARVHAERDNDVRKVEKLLDQVQKTSPQDADALVLRAQLLVDNEENGKGEALLAQVLARNPNHLDALAVLGTSQFLRDDLAAFKRTKARALALNPRNTAFFRTVVELGVRHHRYAEAVELSREAVKLDPQDWYSLADLGQNYLRLGEDELGLKYLREAWKGDRFNVKNYNLLNLFEQVVAKEYEFISSPHFKLRVHKKERAVLERTAVPVLEQAYAAYVKKYRFTPKGPIVVELFREKEHYAVRTIGLGELSALAVCFGRVITSTSPVAAQFNWGQVLWHELNHVFTIQMSRSRVPRWLTEGLADLEPTLVRAEWKRENDFDIYKAITSGRLHGLASMNSAFSRARSIQDMVVAYYQGSLLAAYLIKQFGLGKVLAALADYGRGKRTETILPALTGLDLPTIDQRFRAAELQRLSVYRKSWFVDLEGYEALEKYEQAAKAKPDDPATQAQLALASLASGKRKEAEAAAQRALGKNPKERLGLYVSAQLALMGGRRPEAEARFTQLLGTGADGYEVRLELGKLALARNDAKGAEAHLAQAKRLDPEQGAPYALLASAYEKRGQTDQVIAELKPLAHLEQQVLSFTMKLVSLLAARGDHAGVRTYGEMAYYIAPGSAKLHRLLAAAHAAPAPTPRLEKAIWHLETALLCEPEKPAELHVELARLHLRRGDKRRARIAVTRARALDPKVQGLAEVEKKL
ncbi:MAG: tetratricopeptide repeat protein [Deltaproteobacteria bacterium]|nr:tetratricopeptide repeat protein [Deltaproteobacteria bacterium]